MAEELVICHACRREVKPGQRVIRTYEFMTERNGVTHELDNVGYNHANCFDVDVDDPRYDENDQPITEPRGYVKGRN